MGAIPPPAAARALGGHPLRAAPRPPPNLWRGTLLLVPIRLRSCEPAPEQPLCARVGRQVHGWVLLRGGAHDGDAKLPLHLDRRDSVREGSCLPPTRVLLGRAGIVLARVFCLAARQGWQQLRSAVRMEEHHSSSLLFDILDVIRKRQPRSSGDPSAYFRDDMVPCWYHDGGFEPPVFSTKVLSALPGNSHRHAHHRPRLHEPAHLLLLGRR